jgi:hypothetical protein
MRKTSAPHILSNWPRDSPLNPALNPARPRIPKLDYVFLQGFCLLLRRRETSKVQGPSDAEIIFIGSAEGVAAYVGID